MRIGIDCFQDVQLRSIIESENQIGHCDVQDMDNVLIYDTEKSQSNDLEANMVSIISLYVPGDEVENNNRQRFDKIENRLREDWRIFSPALETEQIRRIILAICKNEYTESDSIFQDSVGLSVLGDSQFLRDKCLTREESWIAFSQALKHEQRFHKHLNLEVLQQLLNSETLHLEISPGAELYRSRISIMVKCMQKVRWEHLLQIRHQREELIPKGFLVYTLLIRWKQRFMKSEQEILMM